MVCWRQALQTRACVGTSVPTTPDAADAEQPHTLMRIGDMGELRYRIHENPFDLKVSDVFGMALRHGNPRRSFLFVSQILGKHQPIEPQALSNACYALATLLAEEYSWPYSAINVPVLSARRDLHRQPIDVPQQTLVIGFAETATAMGHYVFDAFDGDVAYVHSTRECVSEFPEVLRTDEPHSHAREHFLHLRDPSQLFKAEEIIIVDDEISTGATVANLVEAIEGAGNKKRRYSILTFLNWGEQTPSITKLRERGLDVQVFSLLRGVFSCTVNAQLPKPSWRTPIDTLDRVWHEHRLGMPAVKSGSSYAQAGGRFGVHAATRASMEETLSQCGARLSRERRGQNTLCLGSGECMYVPSRLAMTLGENVYFHATTRSPALTVEIADYALTSGICFRAPDDEKRMEYVYNVGRTSVRQPFDELFFFVERAQSVPTTELRRLLASYGFKHLHVVILE